MWFVNDGAIGCGAGCLTSTLTVATGIPALVAFAISPAFGLALVLPTLALLLLIVLGRGVVAVFQRAVWLLAYQDLRAGESPAAPEVEFRPGS